MKEFVLALALSITLLLAGCAEQPQPQPKQTYLCPTGEIVEAIVNCPHVPTQPPVQPPAQAQPEEPEPQVPGTPQQPTPPTAPCGNGVCGENESFASCQQDCAPTYKYLYEYVDGLTYSYVSCDRIGSRVNCWESVTYVEQAEPYFKGDGAKPLYSVYNSYTLRIINDSGQPGRIIKKWVNKTSSDCLLIFENVAPISVFYNASPTDKFYDCPSIKSMEYLGDEPVIVPLSYFPSAQKFRVTYVDNPDAITPKTESMLVWKVKAPLPSYMDYKFIVQGNMLVPVKIEREWSYIDNQGIERHVVSNSTLKTYIEPLEFDVE